MGEGQILGTVIPPDCNSPCTLELEAGTQLDLMPKPNPGFSFAGWSGACKGHKQCKVTLDQPETLEARFVPLPLYPFKVVVTEGGGVSSEPIGLQCSQGTASSCQGQFAEITLMATPKPGYRFRGWTGCEAVAFPVCHIRLSRAREVLARFDKIPASQLILESEGPGGIFGEDNAPLCVALNQRCVLKFEPGKDVLLNATPRPGHLFIQWVGACGSREPECRVKVTDSFGVKALFE